MKKENHKPYVIHSISELHRILALPKPEHPLVSVIDFEEITCFSDEAYKSLAYGLYCIALKKGFEGKMKYGQNDYDFDEGVMSFFSPNQVVTTEITPDLKLSGWWLVIHPDFLLNYTLSKAIKEYGYFSYAVNEALHLSDKEELQVIAIMKSLQQEYLSPIDQYSQDVMISQIELLLNYCNRFYNRQFITRKHVSHDLLVSAEGLLTAFFEDDSLILKGVPTVQLLAAKLNVSPHYLSDMLRQLTGQNAQQHIQNKLMERAKELLTTTSLSVSEIAYKLGFEYPQSFNKLFKNKMSVSPVTFRTSFE
ncbi:helix-turn-helix transcriptional regulator [Pedobacter sp. PLR]|uniref:helix-turn-helix domain-containing protein n=1 Tax=Pedobacter sp. PLR TaxID=2994465 RepID=UPI0022468C6D|nr:helix-turn-helix transcriptional regulator [Pedobacter sp. PLR]MCX2449677.1 helix-turn-helix transcriptional regulator [Pedobacter sp. PLR]